MVVYASSVLSAAGVRHAFTTRIGGVSAPPFDSLNLGHASVGCVRDPQDHIDQNYRLVLNGLGCNGRELCAVRQVHGANVAIVAAEQPHDNHMSADALISDDARRVLSVRVADCVPVLLASEDGRWVAAVHAGWRGIVAGVVPAALGALCLHSGQIGAHQVLAAIGPCIGMDAFEVGADVLDAMSSLLGDEAPLRRDTSGKGHVNLRQAVRIQLLRGGMDESRIDQSDRCTFRDREEFYSHRRDSAVTGRMAALICPLSRPQVRST